MDSPQNQEDQTISIFLYTPLYLNTIAVSGRSKWAGGDRLTFINSPLGTQTALTNSHPPQTQKIGPQGSLVYIYY